MKTQSDKKESVKFFKNIAPGETITFTERIKADGVITAVKGQFYSGQALKLKVRPMVYKNQILLTDLVTYAESCDMFLSGDDEPINHEIAIEVSNDDLIKVWCNNTDTEICTLSLTIEIDYYGGKRRVV